MCARVYVVCVYVVCVCDGFVMGVWCITVRPCVVARVPFRVCVHAHMRVCVCASVCCVHFSVCMGPLWTPYGPPPEPLWTGVCVRVDPLASSRGNASPSFKFLYYTTILYYTILYYTRLD